MRQQASIADAVTALLASAYVDFRQAPAVEQAFGVCASIRVPGPPTAWQPVAIAPNLG